MPKLQAVTICINYSDYLASIVANRPHFDRWLVTTVENDTRTRELCAANGIECVISKELRPDGRDFNAAWNKSRVLNETLALLDRDAWALVLDADVFLPRDFRARLDALPLVPGHLYGLSGRRICDDSAMFEMLRPVEPWDRFCGRNSQPIGYFNLFHPASGTGRYPELGVRDSGIHDDGAFTGQFPGQRRGVLPFTALHSGPVSTNWWGRASGEFRGAARPAPAPRPLPVPGGSRAAFVGYFPGMSAGAWLAGLSHTFLIDHFQIHAPSASPLVEADRRVLRALWEKEHPATQTHPHSAQAIAKIPDDSLDLLYLPGEVAPDWLRPALPLWLPKLKDGAIICGDLYGLPHWPDSTHAIHLLLGAPETTGEDGTWACRHRRTAPRCVVKPGTDGIVIFPVGAAEITPLCATLHSLRNHWHGPALILHTGDPDPALAITCAHYGAEVREFGEAPAGSLLDFAADGLPYTRSLCVPAGTLFDESPAGLFTGTDAAPGPASPQVITATTRRAVPSSLASADPQPGHLIVCDGLSEHWPSDIWEKWCLLEVQTATALAVPIRAGTHEIAVILDSHTAPDFERAWLSWAFPASIRVHLLLDGIRPDELWFANDRHPAGIWEIPAQLGEFAAALREPQITILPAHAAPLPGAELEHNWPAAPTALHERPAPPPPRGEKPLPPPPPVLFGRCERETLLRLLRESAAPYAETLHTKLRAPAPAKFDATRLGWKL